MNKLTKAIEKKVYELRMEHGLLNEYKINLDLLANKMGLIVVEEILPTDVSGLLVVKNGRGNIAVNKNDVKTRKRFTIAHEIGHYHLGHTRKPSIFIDQTRSYLPKYRNANSSTGTDWQEREANAFAAALLMPEHLVRKEYNKDPYKAMNNFEIAEEFGVSQQAMAIRLSNLGYLTL